MTRRVLIVVAMAMLLTGLGVAALNLTNRAAAAGATGTVRALPA